MVDFTDKTVFITGAASGIGKATAMTFAQKGATVVMVDLNEEKLNEVSKKIEQTGGNVSFYQCDVSNQKRVEEVTKDALNKFGKIDILVNNAGIFSHYDSFLNTPSDIWESYINVNLMGMVYVTKALLPQMLEHSYGKIVNVASVAGVYGNQFMIPYSASKGAVISMTKALAKEVIDKGVTVNCISPGSVSTSDVEFDVVQNSEFSKQATYIQRSGSHKENANLICFLASDEASYIVGQNIQIDGCRKMQ